MRLRKHTNKRGEYIVEAAISLPFFLIAVVLMCSIILMYACIEDANFIAATELSRANAEAILTNTSAAVPYRIINRIKDAHSQVDACNITDFGYRVTRWGYDELILINIKMKMKVNNPFDLASNASYDVSAVGRAYVGKERYLNSMEASEIMNKAADTVFIFPTSGEKYHNERCSVLKAAAKSTVLSASLKSKYNSCPVCNSRKASLGAHVYYFPKDGEDYHLPGCDTLQRNYIEIERSVAIQRGYSKCSKCGG